MRWGVIVAGVVSALVGCASTQADPVERSDAKPQASAAATPAEQERPVSSCLGLGPQSECEDATSATMSSGADLSVLGKPLEVCSRSPMTGWFRDGHCRTDASDRGVHTVCAEVNDKFLQFTAARGNDLSSPAPGHGFPGLVAGDRWCLCAARWEEAAQAGAAPKVVLESTDDAALRYTSLERFQEYSVGER